MFKKIVFCAALALQMAAVSSTPKSLPPPLCPPTGCTQP